MNRLSELDQKQRTRLGAAALVIGALTLVIYSLVQRPIESLYGAATVLSGIPLYYFWRRHHNLLQHKS